MALSETGYGVRIHLDEGRLPCLRQGVIKNISICCCTRAKSEIKNLLLLFACSGSILPDYITSNIYATKQFKNFAIHSSE